MRRLQIDAKLTPNRRTTPHDPGRDDINARRPPAFQEYASDLMSVERIKLMTLEERGLFATLRWYCWVNDSIPRDTAQMARLLGLGAEEVSAALTERVLSFFQPHRSAPDRLICGELDGQMKKLIERREKQAEGGRDGARARREKRNPALSNLQSTPVGSGQVREKRREEKNRSELCKGADESTLSITPSAGGADPFVSEMEAAEARERDKVAAAR